MEIGRYSLWIIRFELISTECGYTRLNTTCTHTDEEQGRERTPRLWVNGRSGKHNATSNVNKREDEDGLELSKVSIRDISAQHGHEVSESSSIGKDGLSGLIREVETVDEILDENGTETVVGETLAQFVTDNEEDGLGKVGELISIVCERVGRQAGRERDVKEQ